jgi:hypothetical protein
MKQQNLFTQKDHFNVLLQSLEKQSDYSVTIKYSLKRKQEFFNGLLKQQLSANI